MQVKAGRDTTKGWKDNEIKGKRRVRYRREGIGRGDERKGKK